MYEPIFTVGNLVYLAVLAVALVITFLFTPITRVIAKKTGAVDIPDKERKFHRAPTPRLGGIAIMLGFIVTALCAALIIEGEISKTLLAVTVGGLLICVVGIIDDIFNLPAYIKLLAQIGVATLTAFWGGAIEYTTMFHKTFFLGGWAVPLTVLWIVLIINSMNLIDGLDGLACGVSFLSAVALLVIALLMGDTMSAIIAAALCGATLGFLPYNTSPAAVFMGDSGSMLFGYALACISVYGFAKGAALMSTVAPAIVFALPVIDVIAAFGSRISENKNPFKPDRSHFHYKLMDIGFTSRQAVTIIYIASAVFCGAAIISLYYKPTSLIITGVTCLFLVMLKHIDIILPSEVESARKKNAGGTDKVAAGAAEQTDAAAERKPEKINNLTQEKTVSAEETVRHEEKTQEAPPERPSVGADKETAEKSGAGSVVKKKKYGTGRVAASVVMGEAAKKNSGSDGEPKKQVFGEKISLASEKSEDESERSVKTKITDNSKAADNTVSAETEAADNSENIKRENE